MTRPVDAEQDIPYGDDWHDGAVVDAWAEAADRIRPWRAQFRDAIADRVSTLPPGARVLELGSGPGFLAERVLDRCGALASYSLLDFSDGMLELSRDRLARFPAARFVRADFKSDEWMRAAGGPFDCVVSMQAIHEVRHKRHVPPLYGRVYEEIVVGGHVLICDHVPLDDSAKSAALYMAEKEQLVALEGAGFGEVEIVLSIDKLRLYSGRRVGRT